MLTTTGNQLISTLLDAPTVPCRSTTLGDLWHDDQLTEIQAAWLCAPCPIRQACLQRAVQLEAQTGEAYGIAGGATAAQRRMLARTHTPGARTVHAATWTTREVLAYLAAHGRPITRQSWWSKVAAGTAPAPLVKRNGGSSTGHGSEWDSAAVRAWLSR